MQQVVLAIHLMLAVALIGIVLLQKSEGPMGLGGGGAGGLGGLMSGRGSANLLTRATAVLAAAFMATSLVLAILAGGGEPSRSLLDAPAPAAEEPATESAPAAPSEGEAAPGSEPTVPVGQ